MHTPHDGRPETYESTEMSFSILKLFRTLHDYRWPIALATLGAAVAYGLIALTYYLLSPSTVVTQLPFRFDFQSSAIGQYPNGMKFNNADVVAAPILRSVYDANQLGRYLPYEEFVKSMFVVESNPEYDRVTAEYRSRLTDPKLTSVDRERIYSEYELKLASIAKSNFSVTYVCGGERKCPPATLTQKVLSDALRTWAHTAVNEKKVILYRAPLISTGALSSQSFRSLTQLAAMLTLRERALEVLRSLEMISKIPGSELVRTKDGLAHGEIEMQVKDVLRFQIEPMIGAYLATNAAPETRLQLSAQLRYDQSQLDVVRARHEAHVTAFRTYEERGSAVTAAAAQENSNTQTQREDQAQTTHVLGDAFIDRMVALTTRAVDMPYRQTLIDDMRNSAMAMVPLEAAVAYDERLIEQLGKGGASMSAEQVDRTFNAALASVSNAVASVTELHRVISRQMYAESLYSTAGPTSSRVERAVSLMRLAVFGLVVAVLAFVMAVAGALIHNRMRQDEEEESRVIHELERETVHI